MKDLSLAIVCLSNINRSMEAHAYLARKGFRVKSFGTGEIVSLPGEAPDTPNCYEFGTPYQHIYQDLVTKNREFYTQNGLLHIIDRNKRVKECPDRLHDANEIFDVIITCGERIFDQVVQMFASRITVVHKIVHIVNVDIEDNEEEAVMGAFLILDIAKEMAESEDLDAEIEDLLYMCEMKTERSILYCTMEY